MGLALFEARRLDAFNIIGWGYLETSHKIILNAAKQDIGCAWLPPHTVSCQLPLPILLNDCVLWLALQSMVILCDYRIMLICLVPTISVFLCYEQCLSRKEREPKSLVLSALPPLCFRSISAAPIPQDPSSAVNSTKINDISEPIGY